MSISSDFYREATSRNIGILTEAEQERLRHSTVAIAGLGAVGGNDLVALTRMGVGGFSVADPDKFETVNLHRQAGAFTHTLGRTKVEVMAEMARAINPEVRIRVFPQAFTEENADEFMEGADLVLDGIDFFQVDARRLLYRKAREKGIYAILAAPLAYGATLHVFDPKGMSFDDYFGIVEGMTRAERLAAFAAGLLPKLPAGSQMDPTRVNFKTEKGPALASAVMICSGIKATEVLRILLGRGQPRCVPHSSYFDPYSDEHIRVSALKGRVRWRDRLTRWLAFRRYPSLARLHREELALRACAKPPAEGGGHARASAR
jgi:molybdopterin/thiamine biosynthesis adenylyltransferase